jgi:hypothetical protein
LAITLSENDVLMKEYYGIELPILTFIKNKFLLTCALFLLIRIIFIDILSIIKGRAKSNNYLGLLPLAIIPLLVMHKVSIK